jgi:polysaccharide chain length determinant protein (PEP-CTERM system associated)
MFKGKIFRPEQALQLVWRHGGLLVWAVMLGATLAALVSRTWPDTFIATATIAIDSQRVPESIVRSSVPIEPRERLDIITRDIRSRPRLERLVRELDLAPADATLTETLLESVRGRIRVRGVHDDAFTLSFLALDPDQAVTGARRLMELYIDENLRARDVVTQGTEEFLSSELDQVRLRLLAQEARVVAFRKRNVGELPSQQPANLQALQGYQAQLQDLRDALNRDRDRRIVLERASAEEVTRPEPVAAPMVATSLSARLADAYARRQALEARVTAEHPDRQRNASEIRTLEAQMRAADPGAPIVLVDPAAQHARRLRERQEDLRALAAQIVAKEKQAAALESTIAQGRRRLDNVPVRESELVELTRDYEATKQMYDRLLTKREEAQVAASLERRHIGERFRVLEPPARPEQPEGPARGAVTLLGALLGLLGGLAVLAVLEYRDSTVRTEDEAAGALGLAVLASIPVMQSMAERRRSAVTRLTRGGATACGAVACTATIVWALGLFDRYL